LVGNKITAASEEKLQFGELLFTCLEFTETRPHPGLICDEASIAGIGFGLTAISVAGPVYAEARHVEDSLVSLPQQR
jgi:hypothetical protein